MTGKHCTARPTRFPAALLLAIVLLFTLAGQSEARLHSSRPLLAVGLTSKSPGIDLVISTVGWRFGFSVGKRLRSWTQARGFHLEGIIEPQAGLISGDRDSLEASVVPMLRVEGTRIGEAVGAAPYLEAGVGVLYTGLEGLRLGSNVLFSDQAGLGLSFPAPHGHRWSIGYRFRHISHAGIFGSTNSGMNTHFLTVMWQ